MNKLYLTQNNDNKQWTWHNEWYQQVSPEFDSNTEAEHWHSQIAEYFLQYKREKSNKKLPKLLQTTLPLCYNNFV